MSNVTVSMKMSAKQAGALYMKNIALEKKNAELDKRINEFAEANQTLGRICDLLGIGMNVRQAHVILASLDNMQRFSNLLHRIEREFFMVKGDLDEEFPDEEPEDVCLLNSWGDSENDYIKSFGELLAQRDIKQKASGAIAFAGAYGLQKVIDAAHVFVATLHDDAEKFGSEQ